MKRNFVSILTLLCVMLAVIPSSPCCVSASGVYYDAYSDISSTSYEAYNEEIYTNGINFTSNGTDGFMYSEGAWVSYLVDFATDNADTLVMNMRPDVRNTHGIIGVYADSMDSEPIVTFDQSANIPYGGYGTYAGPGYSDYYFNLGSRLFGKHTIYFKALTNAATFFSSFRFFSSSEDITDCYKRIKPGIEKRWGYYKSIKEEDDGEGTTTVLENVRGCIYLTGMDFGSNTSSGAVGVTVRYARWYQTVQNEGDYEVRLDGIDGEVIGSIGVDTVKYGAYGTYTFTFNRTLTGVHTLVFALPDITNISWIQFNRASNIEFSWIGNSYSGADSGRGAGDFILHDVAAIYVSPSTGKLYTNAFWNEGGNNFSEITDGELTNVGLGSHGWGYEGGYAVTANSKYVYFGQSASYQGKDDGNWPEQGYVWFGVTRRLVSDITKGDSFNGMKSPNGGTSGRYFLPIDNIPVYVPEDGEEQPEGTVPGSSECVISGLAATDSELFVSDALEQKIKVFDANTMSFKYEWSCPGPGQLVIDSYGNLWVVQPEESQLLCFTTDGSPLRAVSVPSSCKLWSAAATQDGRLLVPDRGVNENIRVYTEINKNKPVLSGYIGAEGGIFSGEGEEIGAVGNERFYQISGIGVDADNNIYVCNSGAFDPSDDNSFGTTFIESYTSSNNLRWRLYGLEFLDSAVADPSDPSSVYTKFERFSMDYSKEPGSEWTYAGYTLNPHKYPDDFRLKNNSIHVIAARTLDGVKILYATDMYGYCLYVYRFNPETDGETAIPCMAVYDDPKAKTVTLMQDTTGDGRLDAQTPVCPSETSQSYDHVWAGWNVDSNGNIRNSRVSKQIIDEYTFDGINENGVPAWSYNPSGIAAPAPFNGIAAGGINENRYKDLRFCHYDAENDVMYLTGAFNNYNYGDGAGARQMTPQSKSPGDTIARFEDWSKGNREPAYIKQFDYSTKLYQNKYLNLNSGFAVCGDYIFVSESAFTELGAIHIYDAKTGEWVQDIAYNQTFGELGLMDIVMPLSAVKLSDGRYMIMLEEDLRSKIMAVYWQPPDTFSFSAADFSRAAENGTVSITLEKNAAGSITAVIYFAVYENGELAILKKSAKSAEELAVGESAAVSEELGQLSPGQTIRVMVWDERQRPLKPAEEYVIK